MTPAPAPRASIVVPAYNAQHSLGRCLASLERQSTPRDRYEIIVVDDGSTDGTRRIAEQHRVHVLSQPNRGPAAARNAGARLGRGDVLLYIDADCEATPEWLAQMLAPLQDPSVAGVMGAYRTGQRGWVARFAQIEFDERFERLSKQPLTDMVASYSAAFRRSAFWEAGGFDEQFPFPNHEDLDLSYRMTQRGYRLVFNPWAIVYHTHPETVSRYLAWKFWRGYWRAILYRRYPARAVQDSWTPQLLKAQVALAGLAALILVGWPLLPTPAPLVGGAVGAFVLSTVPFLKRAVASDPMACLYAPVLLLGRACAIGVGFCAGATLGVWRFRRPPDAPQPSCR